MPGVEPHISQLEPWISLGIRKTVPTAELPATFGRTYEVVAEAAQRAGATCVGPAYAEYFGMPTDTVDVEIGFGIDSPVTVPGMTTTERPGTRAVVATHVGPYDQLAQSYAELMPWLEMQSPELTESMFEFYDSEPDAAPEQTVTRLVFPLA